MYTVVGDGCHILLLIVNIHQSLTGYYSMDRLDQFNELIESCRADYDKFFNKHNKTAGVRLRKKMQDARNMAKLIRDEVQKINMINQDLTDSIK